MSKRILCAVFLLLGLAALAFAGGAKESATGALKLVVATDATWPPMEMVDEQKQIVGFDIDLLTAAAKEGGFTVEFKNTAWDGIFAGLEAGKYDAVMSSVTISDERKVKYDFSDPYLTAGQIIVVKADMKGVEKLADLKGKTVGAQIGTTGAFEIEKNKELKFKSYDEIGLAVEDLVNGRIDAVVADNPTAASYVLQNAAYKGKLKIVGVPFTDEYYGIAVKKGNAKVLEAINKGLKKVKESGVAKQLEAKWLR